MANDGEFGSNVATVSITVIPITVNHPPVAFDDAYSVDENATLIVAAPGVLDNDTDPDGDPLTVSLLVSPVSHGVLVLNADGSFDYTPDLDYFGPDSFTYVANDGEFGSNVATVSITVLRTDVTRVVVGSAEVPEGGSSSVPVSGRDDPGWPWPGSLRLQYLLKPDGHRRHVYTLPALLTNNTSTGDVRMAAVLAVLAIVHAS